MKFWGILFILSLLSLSTLASETKDSTAEESNATITPPTNCKPEIYIDTQSEPDGELIGAVRHKTSDKDPRMLVFGYTHLGENHIEMVNAAEKGKGSNKERVKKIKKMLKEDKAQHFINKARSVAERIDFLTNEQGYNKIALEFSSLEYSSLQDEIGQAITRTALYQKYGLTKEESENYIIMRFGLEGYLEYKKQTGKSVVQLFGANSTAIRMVPKTHFPKIINFAKSVIALKENPNTASQVSDADYKKFMDLILAKDGSAPLTEADKKVFTEGFKKTSPQMQADAQVALTALSDMRKSIRDQNDHIGEEMNKNAKTAKDKIIFIGGSSHATGILNLLEQSCKNN